jgi:hypothetical protein
MIKYYNEIIFNLPTQQKFFIHHSYSQTVYLSKNKFKSRYPIKAVIQAKCINLIKPLVQINLIQL